jgi:hypothetical protein
MATASGENQQSSSPLRAIGSAILTAVRCLAGWIVGYLISFISSFGLFVLAHMDAAKPASPLVIAGVTIYCIFFGILGAAVGAQFCRRQAMVIGGLFVLTNLALATWSWYQSPNAAHWTQFIAIFAISPAALFGTYISRPAAVPSQ